MSNGNAASYTGPIHKGIYHVFDRPNPDKPGEHIGHSPQWPGLEGYGATGTEAREALKRQVEQVVDRAEGEAAKARSSLFKAEPPKDGEQPQSVTKPRGRGGKES